MVRVLMIIGCIVCLLFCRACKERQMSVYVDQVGYVTPNKNWKWDKACHMYADTEEELHEFAASIGLKREWFQDHWSLPHYDLTPNMRRKAISAGATSTNRRHLVEFMNKLRSSRRGNR